MHRIKILFNKYTSLSKQGEEFLLRHGKIKTYLKNEIFIQQNQKNEMFGILLDGLVGYSIINYNNDLTFTKVITPFNYFVGSKHVFSKRETNENIHFLKKSQVFITSNSNIQHAIRKMPEYNLMYHILKQKHITICNNYLHIRQLKDEQKLIYFYRFFPELKNQLTINQICSLLGFSNSRQYYISLKKFLAKREH